MTFTVSSSQAEKKIARVHLGSLVHFASLGGSGGFDGGAACSPDARISRQQPLNRAKTAGADCSL